MTVDYAKIYRRSVWAFFILLALFYDWMLRHFPLLIYGDSTIYMELARHLMEGQGYRIWQNGTFGVFSFYPPLYSLALAALSAAGDMPVTDSARWLAMVSLLGMLYFYYCFLRELGLHAGWALLGLVLVVTSWIFPMYYVILSEHLFLLFYTAFLWVFVRWWRRGEAKWLVMAGVFSAFMFLTRYAALGIIGPAVWVIGRYGGRGRWKKMLLYLAPVMPAATAWWAYLYPYGDGLFGRHAAWHPPGREHWHDWVVTLANWMAPGFTRVLAPLLLLVAIMAVWHDGWPRLKRMTAREAPRLVEMLLWLAGGYLLFVVLTISLFDFTTPLDTRLLAPVYFILLALALVILRDWPRSRLRMLLLGLILISHAANFAVDTYHRKTKTLYVQQITSPRLIDFINNVHHKIYSNGKDIIKPVMHDYRLLYDLPSRYDRFNLRPSATYRRDLERVKEEIRRGEASIIFFDNFKNRNFEVPPAELLEIFNDMPVYRLPADHVILITARPFSMPADTTPGPGR